MKLFTLLFFTPLFIFMLNGCKRQGEMMSNSGDDWDKYKSVVNSKCVIGDSVCEITVGKYRYCRDRKYSYGIAIDCKIYDEAKRLLEE